MESVNCGECDVDVPATTGARLIHLVESHPDLYESEVLPGYYEQMAELNSVDRSNFSRQTIAKYLWELEEEWQDADAGGESL